VASRSAISTTGGVMWAQATPASITAPPTTPPSQPSLRRLIRGAPYSQTRLERRGPSSATPCGSYRRPDPELPQRDDGDQRVAEREEAAPSDDEHGQPRRSEEHTSEL